MTSLYCKIIIIPLLLIGTLDIKSLAPSSIEFKKFREVLYFKKEKGHTHSLPLTAHKSIRNNQKSFFKSNDIGTYNIKTDVERTLEKQQVINTFDLDNSSLITQASLFEQEAGPLINPKFWLRLSALCELFMIVFLLSAFLFGSQLNFYLPILISLTVFVVILFPTSLIIQYKVDKICLSSYPFDANSENLLESSSFLPNKTHWYLRSIFSFLVYWNIANFIAFFLVLTLHVNLVYLLSSFLILFVSLSIFFIFISICYILKSKKTRGHMASSYIKELFRVFLIVLFANIAYYSLNNPSIVNFILFFTAYTVIPLFFLGVYFLIVKKGFKYKKLSMYGLSGLFFMLSTVILIVATYYFHVHPSLSLHMPLYSAMALGYIFSFLFCIFGLFVQENQMLPKEGESHSLGFRSPQGLMKLRHFAELLRTITAGLFLFFSIVVVDCIIGRWSGLFFFPYRIYVLIVSLSVFVLLSVAFIVVHSMSRFLTSSFMSKKKMVMYAIRELLFNWFVSFFLTIGLLGVFFLLIPLVLILISIFLSFLYNRFPQLKKQSSRTILLCIFLATITLTSILLTIFKVWNALYCIITSILFIICIFLDYFISRFKLFESSSKEDEVSLIGELEDQYEKIDLEQQVDKVNPIYGLSIEEKSFDFSKVYRPCLENHPLYFISA